jgi:hypothetical protein
MYFKVLCLFHRGDSIPAKLRGSHLVCGRRKRINELQKIFWKFFTLFTYQIYRFILLLFCLLQDL